MTIYDALSQEYGLLIYHDYLLDNNQELLAEICLSHTIELTRTYPLLRSWSESVSGSGSRAWSRSRSMSVRSTTEAASGSYTNSFTRSYSGSRSRSESRTRIL